MSSTPEHSSNTDPTQQVQPISIPATPQRIRRRRRHSRQPKWMRNFTKRFKARVRFINVFLIVVTIMVVLAAGAYVLYGDTASRVQNALSSVNRILSSISNRSAQNITLEDFTRLQTSVNELQTVLSVANARADLMKPLTLLNDDLQASTQALTAAENMTEAVKKMLAGLQPTASFLLGGQETGTLGSQLSSGDRIAELLQLGRSQFIEAQDDITAAHDALAQVDMASLSPSTILTIEEIQGFLDQVTELNTTLVSLPELISTVLGLNGDTNYLVLSQNSDELRPSGGYLSTYGYFTVRDGEVTDYSYSPTSVTSPNPPSGAIEGQPQIPDWWIQYSEPRYAAWDGSWYTDFPSTAEMALWYYDSGNNPNSPIDGVMAIDIIGFEYILEALGSVYVPAYDVTVTPETFRENVYNIRAFGEGPVPHKRFIAAIYQQIFAEWQEAASDPAMNAQLLNVLVRGLQEKHIMLYFEDEKLNNAIGALGWSGEQQAAVGTDYLQVADANLGNKSNRSISRQLTYDVTIQDDGTLASRLNIDYNYPADVAELDPAVDEEFHGPLDYTNLLQVFVPLGSQIVSSEGFFNVPQAVNTETHTIFVGQMQLPYDTSARVQYIYTTPPVVEAFGTYQRYSLLIQKQPGTIGEPVSVTVSLPVGMRVVSAAPEPTATYVLDTRVLEFRLTLTTDQTIEIVYGAG
jgi:hypothetical protein